MTSPLAIWWIRRDLRLEDNAVLAAIRADGFTALPVFIVDPILMDSGASSNIRKDFLLAALDTLRQRLHTHRTEIVIRYGKPWSELSKLMAETGASKIYAEADYSRFARDRDTNVSKHVPLQLVGEPTVAPMQNITKPDGNYYKIFSGYYRAWFSWVQQNAHTFPITGKLPRFHQITPELNGYRTAIEKNEHSFPASEAEASRRLDHFLNGANRPVNDYNRLSGMLANEPTSKLSPYLRFGLISPKKAVAEAVRALNHTDHDSLRSGIMAWVREISFRDFYISEPSRHSLKRSDVPVGDSIIWDNNQVSFEAWKSGLTGYPVVDAGMRQLKATGWIPNRARLIVASFLTKHLLIDWKTGAEWFMQTLIDGDASINRGNWKWVASIGAGSSPPFRILNPIRQSRRFDQDGSYIRRWVPELSLVPNDLIHNPWSMDSSELKRYKLSLGTNYPAPIVEHEEAIRRANLAYRRVDTSIGTGKVVQ